MRRPYWTYPGMWEPWSYIAMAAVVVGVIIWHTEASGHESVSDQVQRIADELTNQIETSPAALPTDVVCARPKSRVFSCRAYAQPQHGSTAAAQTTYDLRACIQGGWRAVAQRPTNAAFPQRVSYDDGNILVGCPGGDR